VPKIQGFGTRLWNIFVSRVCFVKLLLFQSRSILKMYTIFGIRAKFFEVLRKYPESYKKSCFCAFLWSKSELFGKGIKNFDSNKFKSFCLWQVCKTSRSNTVLHKARPFSNLFGWLRLQSGINGVVTNLGPLGTSKWNNKAWFFTFTQVVV